MMPYLQPGMPMPKDLRGLGSLPAGTYADFKRSQRRAVQDAVLYTDMTEEQLRAEIRKQANEARDLQIVIILASAGTTILTTLLASAGLRGLATTVTVLGTAVGAFWAISTLDRDVEPTTQEPLA